MPIQRRTAGGQPIRLVALPAYSEKAVAAWRAFTRSDDLFGLDVESTALEGLGTFDPRIEMRLIQFGSEHEGWALDPKHPKWRKEIVRLLSDPAKRFVSHNAAFDTTRVWFEFGIQLGDRSVDTLPMAALLWPGRTRAKNLKSLCDEFVDEQLSEADHELHALFVDMFFAQKPRKTPLLPKSFVIGESTCRRPKAKGGEKCQETSWSGSLVGYCRKHYLERKCDKETEIWGWRNIPIDHPTFLTYAGLDAVYVRILLRRLSRLIAEKKMNTLSKTEQRVKRYMTGTSLRGMRVDRDWTAEVLDETEQIVENAKEFVIETTGYKPGSEYVKDWLRDQGVSVTSLDKDHLPALIEKYGQEPVVGDVLENIQIASKNSNLLNNLRVIWRHATEGDGFVHPNINTLQAHTGRMSITGPAMQTFAKKGEKGRRLRGCYIARDGHVLVGADYDSQEIRLGAALSRDEMLLKIVLEGLNQHVLTAESLFPHWTTKEECPDEYGAAKVLDFAQQYGAMPKKIAATLTAAGIPTTPREATILWQKWRHTYAGLVQFNDRMARRREVRNPFGRVIPRDPYRDYANGNYMIQSSGRDVLGKALCNLADAGWADNFWLPIHDELVMEVPEDRAEEACAALTEHMTMEVKGILIPAEGEIIGTRWRGL